MGFPTFNPAAQTAMPIQPHPLLVLFFLLLLSCSGETETRTAEAPMVHHPALTMLGKAGHFRTHTIGDGYRKVLERDRDFLFRRNHDELMYSIPFSSTDSAYFDVRYFFTHHELTEIMVDVYLNSDEEATEWFVELKQELQKRLGEPVSRDRFAFWEWTENRRNIEATLELRSRECGRPCLWLFIDQPYQFKH